MPVAFPSAVAIPRVGWFKGPKAEQGRPPMHRYLIAGFALALIGTACSAASEDAAPGTSSPTTTAVPTTIAPSTTVVTETTTTMELLDMELASPAFESGKPIPPRYSCDGENISPHLDISSLPDGTAALALILDDPDAPGGTWDHWIAYDIGPVTTIDEGDHAIGTGGLNSWRETGYGGPCPPSGVHRYFFKLFALDTELGLGEGAAKAEVLNAMEGHVLADATLMGTFTFDE